MANLGKKVGTIRKRTACLTGYGAAMLTTDGDECAIIAPTMRGLERIWGALNWMKPLDKSKVRRAVWFPHEALESLAPRPKKTRTAGKTSK